MFNVAFTSLGAIMEIGESILDSIDEELSFEDVEMMEVEEGEVADDHISGDTHSTHINHNQVNSISPCVDEAQPPNVDKKKKNKKKKKKKRSKTNKIVPGSDAINIDKFVGSVCKRLRERKIYLVYTAVGVLGVSALKDLLKEVTLSLNSRINISDIFFTGACGDVLYLFCALVCLQMHN